MVLLNARLSEKSAAGYARVAGLTRQPLVILQGLPRKQIRTRVGYVRWVPPMRPSS